MNKLSTVINKLNNDFRHTDVGETLNTIEASGCSLFFLTSSLLNLYSSSQNRKNTMKNAEKDPLFQQELQRQKEQYEDYKEAEEKAFKIWLKQRQRAFTRDEISRKWEHEMHKEEVKMFLKDWPLKLSVEAIYKRRREDASVTMPNNINVVIAKHIVHDAKQKNADPLALLYTEIFETIKSHLKHLDIPETNILSFKDDNTIVGGAALANIYAMMSTFPTVVLMPKINQKQKELSIYIGCWSQDSLFPMQMKALSIDYDLNHMKTDVNYLANKKKEIINVYVSIAIVLNDVYMMLEKGTDARFPQHVQDTLQPQEEYKHIIEFAVKEYKSLLQANNALADTDKNLSNKIQNIIQLISK